MIARRKQRREYLRSRASFIRASFLSSVSVLLLCAPLLNVGAQASAAAGGHAERRGWAFGRVGAASSAPMSVATSGAGALISLGGGIAASYGMAIAMARVTDSEQWYGPGVRDWALLGGVRSRGDRLFVTGAAGLARVTPLNRSDAGTSVGATRATLAYDLSAHAAFRVAGLALAISGVLGPPRTSYLAVSLGAELGWFGFQARRWNDRLQKAARSRVSRVVAPPLPERRSNPL